MQSPFAKAREWVCTPAHVLTHTYIAGGRGRAPGKGHGHSTVASQVAHEPSSGMVWKHLHLSVPL
jgi:hypothetical protein